MRTLSTIGYEGATLRDFLHTLAQAKVTSVIDIRDVPASRRPGFSKNVLARALAEEGIAYRHLKPLGDPKPGREAARRGDHSLFIEIYNKHVGQPEAVTALHIAVEIAAAQNSVLLCYERDPKHCHRRIVATMMMEIETFQLRDLGVQKCSDQPKVAVSGSERRAVALA